VESAATSCGRYGKEKVRKWNGEEEKRSWEGRGIGRKWVGGVCPP